MENTEAVKTKLIGFGFQVRAYRSYRIWSEKSVPDPVTFWYRVRIRIRGSVPLDPALFVSVLQDANKKKIFFAYFYF
jgi:hypothetical protein